MNKYQESEEEALKDNRGKRKIDELTPEEKIQWENKRLKQEIERLRRMYS
ncbi:hypothetical protein [Bacillus pumilus]